MLSTNYFYKYYLVQYNVIFCCVNSRVNKKKNKWWKHTTYVGMRVCLWTCVCMPVRVCVWSYVFMFVLFGSVCLCTCVLIYARLCVCVSLLQTKMKQSWQVWLSQYSSSKISDSWKLKISLLIGWMVCHQQS